MARHDEVFVKVGRVPQAADVSLLLDVSGSMAEPSRKRLQAWRLAAALGWLSLAHGDRVRLVPFADSPRDEWGPASGGRRGASLLAHLERVAPADDARSRAGPAIGRLDARSATGGLLVLISDLWLEDDLELALARVPPPRWEVLVLHVLGATEMEPRLDGRVTLRDRESGREVSVVVDEALRGRYRRSLHARMERIRALVAARGAVYALVPASWSLEQAVIPYLQRRALLAR